jgi:magnesium transporter
MKRTVLEQATPPLCWIDISAPTAAELAELGATYRLPAHTIHDALDPRHLPKYERFGDLTFVIVRVGLADVRLHGETLETLTGKLAIFFRDDIVLTMHRRELPLIGDAETALEERVTKGETLTPLQLALELIDRAVDSFARPLEESEAALEACETRVFAGKELTALVERLYHLRRRASLFKRLLWHTADVLQKLVPAADAALPLHQDVRENVDSVRFLADELVDDVGNLLGIQLALAAHRTNEVIRVLTLFSAFFLPLTFIVGVYGMNFRFMPELASRWGYPAVWAVMLFVSGAIFLWIRRRGWLRE